MQAVDLSSQSVDLDTLNDPGKWHINGATATNSPTTGVFLLIVEVGLFKRRVQTAIDISTGETFRRVMTNNQAWQSWHQIYDTSLLTNSTLLSPLASALGVSSSPNTDNIDQLTTPGIYNLDSSTQGTKPYTYTTCIVIERKVVGYPSTFHQIAVDVNGVGPLKHRKKGGTGSWSEWV